MAISPDDGANLAHTITSLVANAEIAAMRAVARGVKAQLDRDDSWQVGKQAQLAAMRRVLVNELRGLDSALAVEVDRIVREAYDAGLGDARDALKDAGKAVRLPPQQEAAITEIAKDLRARVTEIVPRILRESLDAYQLAAAQPVTDTVLGVRTRRGSSQRMLDRLFADGIKGFTDKAGRAWRIESYTEMVVRTGSAKAMLDGHEQLLKASGHDLVRIQPGPRACLICDKWAGKIMSLTGGSRTIVADGFPLFIEGNLEDARANGWAHPNCRCSVGAYFPGYSKPLQYEPDLAGYHAQVEQRRLERRIRKAKREEAVALDGVAGKARSTKVRARQKDLRDFLAGNPDLKRLRYREQIGTAI